MQTGRAIPLPLQAACWAIEFSYRPPKKIQAPAKNHKAEPQQGHCEPEMAHEQVRKTVSERASCYVGEQFGFKIRSEVAPRKEKRYQPPG
jgi:hypothetical protein